MNLGKVTIYLEDNKLTAGFAMVSGIVVMDHNNKPLAGCPLNRTRVQHGDSIRVDFVSASKAEGDKVK